MIAVAGAPSGISAAQAGAAAGDLTSYRLVTSGPDAVVRQAPAGVPAPLAVPPSVPALERLPDAYLPFVQR